KITDMIVCGHSGCGAMHAIAEGLEKVTQPHLRSWLSLATIDSPSSSALAFRPDLSAEDRLSQRSVLQQIANLETYPRIRERIEAGELRLHAGWFDIAQAGVHAYDESPRRFVLIDAETAHLAEGECCTRREPVGANP